MKENHKKLLNSGGQNTAKEEGGEAKKTNEGE